MQRQGLNLVPPTDHAVFSPTLGNKIIATCIPSKDAGSDVLGRLKVTFLANQQAFCVFQPAGGTFLFQVLDPSESVPKLQTDQMMGFCLQESRRSPGGRGHRDLQ